MSAEHLKAFGCALGRHAAAGKVLFPGLMEKRGLCLRTWGKRVIAVPDRCLAAVVRNPGTTVPPNRWSPMR